MHLSIDWYGVMRSFFTVNNQLKQRNNFPRRIECSNQYVMGYGYQRGVSVNIYDTGKKKPLSNEYNYMAFDLSYCTRSAVFQSSVMLLSTCNIAANCCSW